MPLGGSVRYEVHRVMAASGCHHLCLKTSGGTRSSRCRGGDGRYRWSTGTLTPRDFTEEVGLATLEEGVDEFP